MPAPPKHSFFKSLHFNDAGSFLLFRHVLQEEGRDPLPFSQMTGRTSWETGQGGLHADTVQQAVTAGVLPAYEWQGRGMRET